MLNIGSFSINGTSRINEKDVAYFNASFSIGESGNYSSTKSVNDKAMYLANQKQCEDDYVEFDRMTMDYMKQISGV